MSIRSFFKPKEINAALSPAVRSLTSPASKRPDSPNRTLVPDAASNTSELKSPENPEAGGKGKAVLTPEQIETIRKNREQALERKRARAEMDGTVGESAAKKILVPEESIMDAAGKLPASWHEILAGELSKDYFKSLDSFVR